MCVTTRVCACVSVRRRRGITLCGAPNPMDRAHHLFVDLITIVRFIVSHRNVLVQYQQNVLLGSLRR